MNLIEYSGSEWLIISCGCKTNGMNWNPCAQHEGGLIRTDEEMELLGTKKKYNELLAACHVLTKVHLNNGAIVNRAEPEWLYNGVTFEQYHKAWEYIQNVFAGVEK